VITRNIYFLIGFLLTVSLLWPLGAAPFFTHHDDVQFIRLHQMNKCFDDLQLPCRWVPDLGGEYGYPLFNYYAPLPYYYGEIFYKLTGSLLLSVKIMFATSFIGAYVFMYLLAQKFWGKMGGSLAGIFYSYAPYHAVDMYVRGAMGELWGLLFFPAILWSFFRIVEKANLLNSMVFGLLVAFLMLSHNLSAMIFIPLVLVLLLIFYIKNRSFNLLKYSCFGFFLAFLISAFYFLPVTFEKDLVHVETTISGYFSYTEHFKGLRKLFLDRSWGWGASVREVPGGEKDGLSLQIGIVHVLFWILSLITLVTIWKKDKRLEILIIFSSASILFSVFMIHPRSQFIWDLIEPLKYLQFPWRFLLLIIFFISLVSPAVLLITKEKYKRAIWISSLVLVVAANFLYFRPEKLLNVDEKDLLTGQAWDKQIKRSIFDYLPKSAKEPPAELATERYKILTGETTITNFKEKTNEISFKADTKTHTILRLSQYYFPNWRIFDNGGEVKIDYDNTLGLMTIILGVGEHNVQAKLFDTSIRTLGNTLTGFGILLYVILFLFINKKTKRWMSYYVRALRR